MRAVGHVAVSLVLASTAGVVTRPAGEATTIWYELKSRAALRIATGVYAIG